MVAVQRSRYASLDTARFFCLSVLAAVVEARKTVDLFSQFGHIVSDGNHLSTCTGQRVLVRLRCCHE